MTLTIDFSNADAVARCAIEGDLDLASQEDALAKLLPVIEGPPSAVVLDLSKVEFIDSTGLRVLLRCAHHAEERGKRLMLGPIGPAVQRLFDITKVGPRFEHLPA